MRQVVQNLTPKKVQVQFLKENLIFTGEDSPISQLLLSVMGAFAEFERSLIKERQKEGIALAKKRGVYKGRAKTLTLENIQNIKERIGQGVPKAAIARDIDISRRTLYRYLTEN